MSDELQQQQEESFFTLFDRLDKDGQDTAVALLMGRKVTKAAELLGVTRQAIYYRIDKYGLEKIIKLMPKKAYQILMLNADKAAETLSDLMDSKDDKIKLEASKESLDRVGLMGKPDISVQTVTQFSIPDQFDRYDKVSQDSGDNSGGPPPVQGS